METVEPPLRSWTVRPSIWSSSLQQVKRSHHWRGNRRWGWLVWGWLEWWLVGLGHKCWEICKRNDLQKHKFIQMRQLFPPDMLNTTSKRSRTLSFYVSTSNWSQIIPHCNHKFSNTTAEGSPGSLSSTSGGTNSPQQVVNEWKSLQFTTEHLRCFGKLLIYFLVSKKYHFSKVQVFGFAHELTLKIYLWVQFVRKNSSKPGEHGNW